MICPGCGEHLRWWQKKGPPTNDSWHRRCWLSWKDGHTIAMNHCTQMNEEHRLPTPMELYWAGHSEQPYLSETYTKIVESKLKTR